MFSFYMYLTIFTYIALLIFLPICLSATFGAFTRIPLLTNIFR
jgi:hypothetical protein